MLVLERELRSSGRAGCALNHGVFLLFSSPLSPPFPSPLLPPSLPSPLLLPPPFYLPSPLPSSPLFSTLPSPFSLFLSCFYSLPNSLSHALNKFYFILYPSNGWDLREKGCLSTVQQPRHPFHHTIPGSTKHTLDSFLKKQNIGAVRLGSRNSAFHISHYSDCSLHLSSKHQWLGKLSPQHWSM